MFKDGLKGVDHSIVMEACKLADDFTAHDTLTSRQERAERKMLEAHLRDEYGLEAMASEHATLLVECGVLATDKEILDHVYGAQDVEMALGVTVTIMKIRKSVSTIEVAAQKAASVIRALKTYVRNEDVQSATVFDVRRSINDVLLLFGSQLKKGVELHLEMDKQLLLQGNESELSKVWSNLIANALYAMDNNGNLWIAGTTDDKNIILTFSNDGPAIPEEVMSKLFEPFYTTKPVGEGSGMGMSIVFNIVASMNGSIEAETGDRTTFTVTLPKTPMQ
jgi:signal transduction histidine kinase